MASSAPFGTDLQPLHRVRIVGGKLLYVSSPSLVEAGTQPRIQHDRGDQAQSEGATIDLKSRRKKRVVTSPGENKSSSVSGEVLMASTPAEETGIDSVVHHRLSQEASLQHDAHKIGHQSCSPNYLTSDRQEQLRLRTAAGGGRPNTSLLEGMSSLRRALHKCSTTAG